MEDNSEAKPLAQIERHSYSEVGWISRQNLLALRSRDNFFLDIPFYRTPFACWLAQPTNFVHLRDVGGLERSESLGNQQFIQDFKLTKIEEFSSDERIRFACWISVALFHR